MSWALALAGIFLLVIFHELGHFFAAKATGMRVEQLSLFFGPKIVRIKRGETEYCIGTIPAGGYAKITGMNPEEEVAVEVPAGSRSSPGLVTAMSTGDRQEAAPTPETVTMPASEYPRSYYAKPVWKRIVVVLAGPAVNLALAFLILFGTAFIANKPTQLEVTGIESGSPAAKTLEPGDTILGVDGYTGRHQPLDVRAAHFAKLTASHHCPGGKTVEGCRAKTPVNLTIERDGQRQTVKAKPYYDPDAKRTRLGFTFQSGSFVDVPTPSVTKAASESADTMWQLTSTTVSTFAKIFDPQEREKLGSVVGATEATHQAFEFDAYLALRIIGLISLSLALVNLFPFLPLDGGHVFWSVVEKIRGRRPSLATMERASVLGILLVLIFAYVGISNDIDRLSSGGFNVR
jgi:regulator of sigma E protease